jgi:hypothetical protein
MTHMEGCHEPRGLYSTTRAHTVSEVTEYDKHPEWRFGPDGEDQASEGARGGKEGFDMYNKVSSKGFEHKYVATFKWGVYSTSLPWVLTHTG